MYQCKHISLYTVHLCVLMANIPSLCGIISKHMYPLVLLKIAPICMKITTNFLGKDTQTPPPFNHIFLDTLMLCIHINNKLKFKYAAAPFTYTCTLYAHAHTGSLHKYKKNHMKTPVLRPFCTNILKQPPPPLDFFCFFFSFLKFCCGWK